MTRWKARSWGMVLVGLLVGVMLLAGLVVAQSTRRETVIWDFVNGLKSHGQPITTACTGVAFTEPGDPSGLPMKVVCP